MRPHLAMLFFGLTVLGVTPLFGDENLKAPVTMTSTERLDFGPGGVIRVDGSRGDLYVEGWDRAQVEITVTKFVPYDYERAHPERSAHRLEGVRVVAERRSPSELVISTTRLPGHSTGKVRMEYQVRVPRDSRLAIRHGAGYVSVSDVTGDIEASCRRGDIILWLQDNGTYTIDARNKLGKVSSDFAGASSRRFLVGQKFTNANPAPAQRLYLRMGFGGITLKPILPEPEAMPRSASRRQKSIVSRAWMYNR